jgi:hypothetical protein
MKYKHCIISAKINLFTVKTNQELAVKEFNGIPLGGSKIAREWRCL